MGPGSSPGVRCLFTGAAIGFAAFSKIFPTDDDRLGARMKDLFIRAEARGRGIGRLLIMGLSWVRLERGYKRFFWTATRDNEAAIGLYYALGAERRDEKLHYHLNTAAIARLSEGD